MLIWAFILGCFIGCAIIFLFELAITRGRPNWYRFWNFIRMALSVDMVVVFIISLIKGV